MTVVVRHAIPVTAQTSVTSRSRARRGRQDRRRRARRRGRRSRADPEVTPRSRRQARAPGMIDHRAAASSRASAAGGRGAVQDRDRRRTPSLPAGVRKVVADGLAPALKLRVYRALVADGVEGPRPSTAEKTVAPPVDEVVAVGTPARVRARRIVASAGSCRRSATRGSSEARHRSPHASARRPPTRPTSRRRRRTEHARRAPAHVFGVIAVDPRVIPLGTHVYVPGLRLRGRGRHRRRHQGQPHRPVLRHRAARRCAGAVAAGHHHRPRLAVAHSPLATPSATLDGPQAPRPGHQEVARAALPRRRQRRRPHPRARRAHRRRDRARGRSRHRHAHGRRCAQHAGAVVAVERDADLLPALAETTADCARFAVVRADAVAVSPEALAEPFGPPVALVANLPYAVAATVVLRFFEELPDARDARRSWCRPRWPTAWPPSPGSKEYGSYTVKLRLLAAPAGRFAVAARRASCRRRASTRRCCGSSAARCATIPAARSRRRAHRRRGVRPAPQDDAQLAALRARAATRSCSTPRSTPRVSTAALRAETLAPERFLDARAALCDASGVRPPVASRNRDRAGRRIRALTVRSAIRAGNSTVHRLYSLLSRGRLHPWI